MLTAIKFDHQYKNFQLWLFECECGNKKVIRVSAVKNGNTKSCGCLSKRMISERNYKHGMHGTRTYISWVAMKTRCLNKSRSNYHYYGGRGITICPQWLGNEGFINFYADMGDRPEGKTLDRFPDNDGNYTPKNCRWATPREQRLNQY